MTMSRGAAFKSSTAQADRHEFTVPMPKMVSDRRGSAMPNSDFHMTRRGVLLAGAASLLPFGVLFAATEPLITVHKDPSCGCCSGWVQHLQKAGFPTKVLDTGDVDAVKKRLGVPDDLAACHTAEVSGYVVEGHVPATALKRFLAEMPNVTGLAVPGMPVGSPGMEGGTVEKYEVVLFGPSGRRSYMRFLGSNAVD
jgi:hypothetical protein